MIMVKHSESLCKKTWNELDKDGRGSWLFEADLTRRKQIGFAFIDWAAEFWEDLPSSYRQRLSKFMARCLK